MAIYQFCKNTLVLIQDRAYTMKQEVEDNIWQLEDSQTGRIHEYALTALQEMYAKGELVFPRDAHNADHIKLVAQEKSRTRQRDVSQKLWEKAKLRLAYVKAILDLPASESILKPAVAQAHQDLNIEGKAPHWISVVKWRKQFIAHGKDTFALVDQHHDKGNRTARYPDEVVVMAQDCIERYYLTRERGTIEETLDHLVVAVHRENEQRLPNQQLPIPTRRLVHRLISHIPSYDRYAARYGKTAANRLFRSKLKHHITQRPLQAAEMDHTKLDVFVIDDDSHLPLGRPWITICIDNHTRCILGIYIGFEPPSFLSVGKCLKHAILPKNSLHQTYPEIQHPWEAHGVMDRLIVDNGLEFHSLSLEQACLAFGIELEYTPRKQPWFKGKIERFNGTLNRTLCHGIAGTSFSNIFDKDDYDPAKHAILTLSNLRLIVHKWIADYYHQKPHRSLDHQSPAIVWSNSIRAEDIQLAHNPAEMDVLLGKTIEQKTITHKGIELNGLLYNSPELMQIRRQRGDTFKADIRMDESDVGYVYVMLNQFDYLKVPALNTDAHGISLWLHNVFRKYAKERLGKIDRVTYARARVEIQAIVEEAMQLKRKKANSRSGRYLDNMARKQSSKRGGADANSGAPIEMPIVQIDTPPIVFLPTTQHQATYTPILQTRGRMHPSSGNHNI